MSQWLDGCRVLFGCDLQQKPQATWDYGATDAGLGVVGSQTGRQTQATLDASDASASGQLATSQEKRVFFGEEEAVGCRVKM